MWSVLGGIVLAMSVLAPWSHADSGALRTGDEHRPRSRIRQVRGHLARILREGDSNLYLSGHAHHARRSYPAWLVPYLNENAWGGGLGKSLPTRNGVASIGFTAFLDSVGEWEYNLGYMREWRTAPFDGRLTLGGGLSALVISRPDYFRGTPFPAVLPQLSLGYGSTTLIAMFVPRLPETLQPANGMPELNGDIVYTFARIKL